MGTIFVLLLPKESRKAPPSAPLHSFTRFQSQRLPSEPKGGHRHEQKLTPAMEKSLRDWCTQLDDWGFPARLDLLQGMADALTHIRPEEDPTIVGLGKRWIYNFLNRNPDLAAKYGTQLDRQHAYASNLRSLRDYYRKLLRLIQKHGLLPQDIFNMDERGFIIGRSAGAKVICRAGRRPPRVTHDGTREMLTAIECCCVNQTVQPSCHLRLLIL